MDSQRAFAFIDSQNLHLGVRQDVTDASGKRHRGWVLDYGKFRRYLADKYGVTKAFLFIGYVEGNEDMYAALQQQGYIIVLSRTSEFEREGETHTKGNVDTDLVLHAAAEEFNNYDKAVIVSGDGDFYVLYEFLKKRGKLGAILVPNRFRYSSLLKPYLDIIDFISPQRGLLEYRPRRKAAKNPEKTK